MEKSYFWVDDDLNLVESSIDEILDIFAVRVNTPKGAQPKYFYDESSKTIKEWLYGKEYTLFAGDKFTKEEAKQELLKLALEEESNVRGYSSDAPRFLMPEPAEELLETVQKHIENFIDEDEEGNDEHVQNIIKKLRECESALKLVVSAGK